MLATIPNISMGWTMGRSYWAWASWKHRDAAATYTKGTTTDEGGLGQDSFGLLCFLSSSSCIPLLPL
jgi:hypothetical protein